MAKNFKFQNVFWGAFLAFAFCPQANALDLETLFPEDLQKTLEVIAEPAPDDGRYLFVTANDECTQRFEELARAGQLGNRHLARSSDIATHLFRAIANVGEFNAHGVRIPRFDASRATLKITQEFGQGYLEVNSATYSHYSETEITVYSDINSHLCFEEALIH